MPENISLSSKATGEVEYAMRYDAELFRTFMQAVFDARQRTLAMLFDETGVVISVFVREVRRVSRRRMTVLFAADSQPEWTLAIR